MASSPVALAPSATAFPPACAFHFGITLDELRDELAPFARITLALARARSLDALNLSLRLATELEWHGTWCHRFPLACRYCPQRLAESRAFISALLVHVSLMSEILR